MNINNSIKILLASLLINLLLGCASTPKFDTSKVDLALTPQQVLAEPDRSKGQIVLWGGTIIDIHNLSEATKIEVLAYPLSTSQQPLLNKKPLGRFLIYNSGFLDPSVYSQGRQISVMGKVRANQSGAVGDAVYTYPVLEAQQLDLWTQYPDRSRSTFQFGIGIGIHN